jgi:hypothetical protein
MSKVQCTGCGKVLPDRDEPCPACGSRERVPFRPVHRPALGWAYVRKGLVYMALAAAFGYLMAHQDKAVVSPVITHVLVPTLFLGGLGLALFGLLRR